MVMLIKPFVGKLFFHCDTLRERSLRAFQTNACKKVKDVNAYLLFVLQIKKNLQHFERFIKCGLLNVCVLCLHAPVK